MSKTYGNGSGKFDIGVHDTGGWVRILPGNRSSPTENLGAKLAHRLSEWFQQNGHLRLVNVVPFDVDGSTVKPRGIGGPARVQRGSFPVYPVMPVIRFTR